jgi:hypothetical protein
MTFADTVEHTSHPRWKYRLKAPYTFPVGRTVEGAWDLYGQSAYGPKKLGMVQASKITVFPGYSWDGATGAPTWPRVLRATLEHDLGCQMQASPGFRVYIAEQREVDWWLFRTASADRFVFSPLYYAAVRLYWTAKGAPPYDPETYIQRLA